MITGFSDLLVEDIADLASEDPRLHSALSDVEKVNGAAQRAIRLTRQLLIFARSDVVNPEVLSLNDIISGLDPLLERTLGEHITLTVAPADDLWRVKADAGQIEQVLVNLAVNARDAMPTAQTAGQRHRTRPRDVLRHHHRSRRLPPRLLRTRLGTTISGLLPATTEHAHAAAGPPAAVPRGRGETILLVEDETSLQELAARILTRNRLPRPRGRHRDRSTRHRR